MGYPLPTRIHVLTILFILTLVACGIAALFSVPGFDRACIGFTFAMAVDQTIAYLDRLSSGRP